MFPAPIPPTVHPGNSAYVLRAVFDAFIAHACRKTKEKPHA